MLLAFFQARMWLVWIGAASLVYGAGVWSGMSVQHLRESAARETLQKEINTLQAAQMASERANADQAISEAETVARLSAVSIERLAGILEGQVQSDARFRQFIEDNDDDPDACRCRVADINRDRWLRLDAARTGDPVRDEAGPDTAGDD